MERGALNFYGKPNNGYTERIPTDVLEAAKRVGESRKALRRMLEKYIPRTGYAAPERPRILNLGCGVCYEALVLSGYFGGKPWGFESKDVLLVGIDIDKKEVERAKQEYTTFELNDKNANWIEKPNYRFIQGDARRLRELVNGEFDVVVARHPNVAELPDTWSTIFRESHGLMRPEGLLIATAFSDIEHEILEEQVQKAGYTIALSTANAYALPLPHSKVSIDRNVLFARKR